MLSRARWGDMANAVYSQRFAECIGFSDILCISNLPSVFVKCDILALFFMVW